MGGRSSKEQSYRQSSSTRSTSSTSWNQQDYVQSPSYAPRDTYAYPAYNQQPYNPPPSQNYGGPGYEQQRKQLDRKYSRIADNYNSLDEREWNNYDAQLLECFFF